MAKPILHIELSPENKPWDGVDVQGAIERISEEMSQAGYVTLVTFGNTRSPRCKILSPRRMKRADYAAVVNASKRINAAACIKH